MNLHDIEPDLSDRDFDKGNPGSNGPAPRSSGADTFSGVIAGAWIGAVFLAEFVVYHTARQSLLYVMTISRSIRYATPVSAMIYASIARRADLIGALCGLFLVLKSMLRWVMSQENRLIRLAIGALYFAALVILIMSASGHMDMYMVAYGNMNAIEKRNEIRSGIEITCIIIALALGVYADSHSRSGAGKTII